MDFAATIGGACIRHAMFRVPKLRGENYICWNVCNTILVYLQDLHPSASTLVLLFCDALVMKLFNYGCQIEDLRGDVHVHQILS